MDNYLKEILVFVYYGLIVNNQPQNHVYYTNSVIPELSLDVRDTCKCLALDSCYCLYLSLGRSRAQLSHHFAFLNTVLFLS